MTNTMYCSYAFDGFSEGVKECLGLVGRTYSRSARMRLGPLMPLLCGEGTPDGADRYPQ